MLGYWLGAVWSALAAPPADPGVAPVPVSVVFDNGSLQAPWFVPQGDRDGPSVFAGFERALAAVPGVEVAVSEDRPRYDRAADELEAGRLFEAALERRAHAGPGPRLEVLVGPLVEVDATGCFDAARLAEALGRVQEPAGQAGTLDHVALGVLRATAEPPPELDDVDDDAVPWGHRAPLARDDDGCVRVVGATEWHHDAASFEIASAALVLGFGTEAVHTAVSEQLDRVERALASTGAEVAMVRLRSPPRPVTVRGWMRVGDAPVVWALPAVAAPAWAPCASAAAIARVRVEGQELPLQVGTTCDSLVSWSWPAALRQRFGAVAGVDPRKRTLALAGEIDLQADAADLEAALTEAAALARAERPVVGWEHAAHVLGAAPWSRQVVLGGVELGGLDQRPWPRALIAATVAALAGFWLTTEQLRRARVRRALRRAWKAAQHQVDPLVQRPVAKVLRDGHQAASGGRLGRWALGVLFAAAVWAAVVWGAIRATEVWGG